MTQIKFGTDGWRGVIADDFTFDNVRRVANAIASYVLKHEEARRGVIVGCAVGSVVAVAAAKGGVDAAAVSRVAVGRGAIVDCAVGSLVAVAAARGGVDAVSASWVLVD